MTTITSPAAFGASFSLLAFIATLLQVELREKLDADTNSDKADAAYHWGM
ncbi:MAG TPA: hypothetical protein VFG03_13850 [Telluria sp.]|nr:hypothetical protein [Telluria sp.]